MAWYGNAEEANPVRLIQYSTSDLIIAFTPAATPCSRSSLSHTHRSMVFFHNETFALAEADSVRPIDYSVSDSRVEFAPATTPCSRSSLSHEHRLIVFFPQSTMHFETTGFAVMAWHGNAEEANPVRLIQYSTSDLIIAFTPVPTPCSRSSLSHAHRSTGFFCYQTFTLVTDSARPIDYSVSDIRVVFTPAPTP